MISPNPSNCSETDHHLHHHVHHTATAASQTGGHSGSSRVRIVSSSNVCGARCKSMLGYQPHQQMVTGADVAAANSCSDTGSTGGRYSPHPNEMFLHHHGKLSIQPIAGYDDTTNCCLPPPSPAPNSDRYIMGVTSPQSVQICGANGNLNCLEMHTTYANYDGGGSNGSSNGNAQSQQANVQQHHQHQHIQHAAQSLSSSTSISPLAAGSSCATNLPQKYVSSMQQCSISPNMRFRLSDRYREVPTPKSLVLNSSSGVSNQNAYVSATGAATSQPSGAARYVTSAHFLAQSTPLMTSNTYTYLSSTVHTPVKRYVPTPPPPTELYTDISMQPSPTPTSQTLNKCGNSSNVVGSNGAGSHATHHVNTLPYRFRMKCCTNESPNPAMAQTTNTNTSHLTHNLEHRPLSVTDYYATSPRTRPNYANSSHSSQSGHNSYACYSGNSGSTNGMEHSKCTTATGKDSSIVILHDQQMQITEHSASIKVHGTGPCLASSSLGGSVAGSVSGRSSSASPITVSGSNGNGMYVVGGSRLNTTCSAHGNNANVINDYIQRTPSIEYINATAIAVGPTGGRICTTPVTQVTQIEGNSGSGPNNSSGMNSTAVAASTCLHCNTVRRTTGVHQTTQTTGPISPIPLQQIVDVISTEVVGRVNSCNGGFLRNVSDQTSLTLTPSTNESHISPLSPSVAGAHHSRILFPSKVDDGSLGRVEHLQQQQQQSDQLYIAQKLHQQKPKNVITQGTITDHISNNGGSIGGQQQQLHAVGGSRSIIQQQPTQQMQQHVMHQQQQPKTLQQSPMQQQQQMQRFSRKKRFSQYIRKEIARFFGVDPSTEAEEFTIWQGRQRRLALRRFGALKSESELHAEMSNNNPGEANNRVNGYAGAGGTNQQYLHFSERPDILPAHDTEDNELAIEYSTRRRHFLFADFKISDHVERKASVATMIMSSITLIVHTLNRRTPRNYRQWSRSFAPAHVNNINGIDNSGDVFEGLSAIQGDEVFFDSAGNEQTVGGGNYSGNNNSNSAVSGATQQSLATGSVMRTSGSAMAATNGVKIIEHHRQIYMGERVHGWRTSSVMGSSSHATTNNDQVAASALMQQASTSGVGVSVGLGGQRSSNACGATSNSQHSKKPAIVGQIAAPPLPNVQSTNGTRGNRISAQLLDGVLENSRRPIQRKVKLFSVNDLDDRNDHRPFFTYWINTVQILVLLLSLICYGIGPIGIGVEQKTGQVLVTSLSLQTVQHTEQRNVWIGPRNNDLVHMGAKFATCMRSDVRIIDVLLKTRRQERETACCIRNDDSGCVQSSQADCSVRGLFPTKSISTWKKWSPGESGPGGRISGSVCGLDPKYCDAPASIAPYEWPDDITKWPICRKTNSFSQRFRYKDHTAEHMVCEVIGHPCCTGVYGECLITTREYCDFVNGYFHEEASLCSQISCLNNVCGMLPFFSVEVPDQFYRLFTSLCLHAGILHLAITIAFQHVFLADLERLIGPIRTAIVYIGSGLAGNLTSAVLVPYKPEVGPLASLCGVVASLVVLLILIHWKHLRKPHIALFKLICTTALLFGIGTLPWQLNFAGLLAGIFCGIFLTIALVPFVSITKYGRKAKINLIWSCVIFHLFIYSVLLVIFYVFPTELTSLNVGEVLGTNFNSNSGSGSNVADGVSVGVGVGGIGLSSSHLSGGHDVTNENGRSANGDSRNSRYQPMQQQYYYHHRSSDIITSGTHMLKNTLQQQQQQQQQQKMGPAAAFYHYAYHMNRSNYQMSGKHKYYRNINGTNSFTNYYYTDANSSKVQLSGIAGGKMLADKMKSKDSHGVHLLEANGAEEVVGNSSNSNHLILAYNGKKNKITDSVNAENSVASDIKTDVRLVPQLTGEPNRTLDHNSGRHVASEHSKNSNYASGSDENNNSNSSKSGSPLFEQQPHQQEQKLHSGRTKLSQSSKINDVNGRGSSVGVRSQHRAKLIDILDTLHNSGEFEDVGDIEDNEALYMVEADTEDMAIGKQQHSNAVATAELHANIAVTESVQSRSNAYDVSENIAKIAKLNDNNDGTLAPINTATVRRPTSSQRQPHSSIELPVMNLHKSLTKETLAYTRDADVAHNACKTHSDASISSADTVTASRIIKKTKLKLFSTALEIVAVTPQKQIATTAAAARKYQ